MKAYAYDTCDLSFLAGFINITALYYMTLQLYQA